MPGGREEERKGKNKRAAVGERWAYAERLFGKKCREKGDSIGET